MSHSDNGYIEEAMVEDYLNEKCPRCGKEMGHDRVFVSEDEDSLEQICFKCHKKAGQSNE